MVAGMRDVREVAQVRKAEIQQAELRKKAEKDIAPEEPDSPPEKDEGKQ